MGYEELPTRLTALTTYLISQTARIAKRDLDARLAEHGLRLRHMAVLALAAEGPVTQLDVTRRLKLDPSDVTMTVDELEAGGLVTRRIDRLDRRRKAVVVTAKGRRRFAELERLAHDVSTELLAPIPERRRAQLHADLRRVLVAYDERGS